MTRDEMIELLGWHPEINLLEDLDTLIRVEHIVEVAVLREREACAKVCDELAWDDAGDSAEAMRHCAAAIKARGSNDKT